MEDKLTSGGILGFMRPPFLLLPPVCGQNVLPDLLTPLPSAIGLFLAALLA